MNMKSLVAAGILAATAGATGIAGAQTIAPHVPVVIAQNAPFERSQRGSNVNMDVVRRRLDRAIAQLRHDDRDYGGHRIAAINALQAARAQIGAAEEYARTHGY